MPDPAAGRQTLPAAGQIPADTPVPSLSAAASPLASARAGVAVCFAFESARPTVSGLPASAAIGKALARLMKEEGFRGKRREILSWASGGRFPAARYLVVGLGKAPLADGDALREGCGLAARKLADLGAEDRSRRAVVQLPAIAASQAGPMAEAAAEGFLLGSYRMTKYLTGDRVKPLRITSATLLCDRDDLGAVRSGVTRGGLRARAANLARDLVNEPAGSLTPSLMAATARRLAKDHGLEIRVLEKRDLQRLGMGAILGVSAGSAQPPCLIHLIYRPRGTKGGDAGRPRIALVGKGLTFDSGGLSLKTAAGMETMKQDKAGSCAVLGVMTALPAIGVDAEVHGIMAMTENMPGGSAIKPGDVLRSCSGKTIEVLNTDAEGRLVLADALHYAQQQGVDRIIDLATLTGACVVALGPAVAGAFGNRQDMVDALLAAARRSGEPMWQLPLVEEYAEHLRSDVADLKNSPGTRYGGAITAGLFLRSFVDDKMPWIHLDIAGPAFFESDRGYTRKGGTGAGVRTLLTYIEGLAGR